MDAFHAMKNIVNCQNIKAIILNYGDLLYNPTFNNSFHERHPL